MPWCALPPNRLESPWLIRETQPPLLLHALYIYFYLSVCFCLLQRLAEFGHDESVLVVRRRLGDVVHDILERLDADVLTARAFLPDVQVKLEDAWHVVEVHAKATLLPFAEPRLHARLDLVEQRQVFGPQVAYGLEGRVLEHDEVADVVAAGARA